MKTYECLNKERDNSNSIRRLLLKDLDTGSTQWVDKDKLKLFMSQNKIQVTNLRVDSGGKLVDTESQAFRQPQNPSNSDDETLRVLRNLEATSKESDARVIRILRDMYIKQKEMGDKLDTLLNTPDKSVSSNELRMEGLANGLIENAGKLSEIKQQIAELSNKLSPPADQTKKAQAEQKDKSKSVIAKEAGGYPKPDNPYQVAMCEQSFMFGRNSLASSSDPEEINMDLNRMYIDRETYEGAYRDNKVPMDVINKLRDEIDKASLAYKYTKEEFENTLANELGIHTDLGLMSVVYGALSDKINEIPGFIGETATGRSGPLSGLTMKKFGYAVKDLSLSVAARLPGFDEYEIQDKRRAIRFKESKKLTPSQISDIKNFTDGMWNDASRFIMNDPEWEIKLFVIQFLTKQYTGKYNVSGGAKRVIQSEQGEHKTYKDGMFDDKYANKLTETCLTNIAEFVLDGRMTDKYYLEACTRIFIGYFAAKKVMYSYGMYPFDKTATRKVNGLFIDIIKIAALMMNVNQGTIDGIITEIGAPESEKRRSVKMGKPERYEIEPTTFQEMLGGQLG